MGEGRHTALTRAISPVDKSGICGTSSYQGWNIQLPNTLQSGTSSYHKWNIQLPRVFYSLVCSFKVEHLAPKLRFVCIRFSQKWNIQLPRVEHPATKSDKSGTSSYQIATSGTSSYQANTRFTSYLSVFIKYFGHRKSASLSNQKINQYLLVRFLPFGAGDKWITTE